MAVEIGVAYLSIVPSTRGLAQGLARDFGEPAEKAGRDAGKSIEDGLQGGAQRGGRQAAQAIATTLGSAAVITALNRAKDAASDLQQAVGGTAAVFGEAGDEVSQFAEDAAAAVGLSERAARETTSQLGSLLQGIGFDARDAAAASVELTQAGADLAATLGGNTADAVSALGGILRGEFDPAERFGIALRQADIDARAVALGLAESTSSVDGYARAQAALDLITERSAFAQGTFTAEAGSAAGAAQIAQAKMENAAASLGQNLLPITAKVSEAVAFLADVFTALPGPAQTGLLALAGVAALAGPVTSVVTAYRALVPAVAAGTAAVEANVIATNSAVAVNNLYATSSTRAALASRALGTALGVAGAAFAGYVVASGLIGNRLRQAEELGDATAESARNLLTNASSFEDLTRRFEATVGERNRLLSDLQGSSSPFDADFRSDVAEQIDSLDEVIGQYDQLGDVVRAYAETQGVDLDQATQVVIGHTDELAVLLAQGLTPAEAAAEVATSEHAAAQARSAEAATRAADAYHGQTVEVERLAEAAAGYLDIVRSSEQADLDHETALLDTAQALRDLDDVYADSETSAEDRQRAVIDAYETALRQSNAAVAAAEADNGAISLSAQESARIQIESLLSVADNLAPGNPLRERLLDYATELGQLPTRIATDLLINVYGINPNYGQDTEPLIRVGAHAAGGKAKAGSWSWTGEKGPELVHWGSDAAVFSSRDSMAMLAQLDHGSWGGMTVIGKPDEWTVANWEAAGRRAAKSESRASAMAVV